MAPILKILSNSGRCCSHVCVSLWQRDVWEGATCFSCAFMALLAGDCAVGLYCGEVPRTPQRVLQQGWGRSPPHLCPQSSGSLPWCRDTHPPPFSEGGQFSFIVKLSQGVQLGGISETQAKPPRANDWKPSWKRHWERSFWAACCDTPVCREWP